MCVLPHYSLICLDYKRICSVCVFLCLTLHNVYFLHPHVSEAAVIRGCHYSVPLRPLHPVIFPSSARALYWEGGSVTSLPRTTTSEGGTRFTQPPSEVTAEKQLSSQAPFWVPHIPWQKSIFLIKQSSSKSPGLHPESPTVSSLLWHRRISSLSSIRTHGSHQKR